MDYSSYPKEKTGGRGICDKVQQCVQIFKILGCGFYLFTGLDIS